MNGIVIQKKGSKCLILAAIPFRDLKNVVRFTHRTPIEWNPYEDDFLKSEEEDNYYQRLVDSTRVKELEKFILESLIDQEKNESTLFTVFPSSMILAIEQDIDFPKSDTIIEFGMPNDQMSCLIVDGQHRLAGMLNLYQKTFNTLFLSDKIDNEKIRRLLDNYIFNCTVLVNLTLWEQAQLFTNVNFYQKRVNKSLFYDIFGSTPPEQRNERNNGIYLSHALATFLNSAEKSPIKGFIKMLGTGKGYFSQAFLVEAILTHFSTRGVWSFIEEDYRKKGIQHKKLPKVFAAYFDALKETFPDQWPQENREYTGILVKTTGMGALIRLLGYLYKILDIGAAQGLPNVDFETISRNSLKEIFIKIFEPISNKGSILFGKDSEFAGAGSAGLQSKLYKRLGQELDLFKKD